MRIWGLVSAIILNSSATLPDPASVQGVCVHTTTLGDICPTCEVIQVVLLAFLVPEFKEVSETTGPDPNETDEACIDDVLDSRVNHALNNTEEENTHRLCEIKQRIWLSVIIEFKTANFKTMSADSSILDTPDQSHNKCKQVELVDA